MIKINLTAEQRTEIEKMITKDIKKNSYPEIEKICNYLKDANFIKTAEFIDTEEKVIKICLLSSKTDLIDFQKKINKAYEEDSKWKCSCLIDRTREYIKDELENLYLKFSNRNAAYNILRIMKVNVCPYCNRQYTFTIRTKTSKKIGEKIVKTDLKSRPEFDHFFPKSDYPFLALSIYNLVPSCSLCNKGKSNTPSENFLYPYEESFGDKGIHFEIQNVIGNLLKQEEIIVKLQSAKKNQDLIKQYNDSFKIESLYEQHVDYISELLYKNYIFNDEAIESIYRSYEKLFKSPSELKQLILGNYKSDNFNQRPLSKLTNDILHQLNCK